MLVSLGGTPTWCTSNTEMCRLLWHFWKILHRTVVNYTIIMSRSLKVTGNHVMYDRGAWFLRGCLHDIGLSSRCEFTPVPSYGSVFVYMIPTQNVMSARVIPARVHPGSCAGARFSSRWKFIPVSCKEGLTVRFVSIKVSSILRHYKTRTPTNTALCKHIATFYLARNESRAVIMPRGRGEGTRYIPWWGGAARHLIPWPCLRQISLIFLPCLRQNSGFLIPCLRHLTRILIKKRL